MTLTLFTRDEAPHMRPPGPAYRVDEFAWTRESLARLLRDVGMIDAIFTLGSWRIWRNADGTFSGEIDEWLRRGGHPEPDRFDRVTEPVAAHFAYLWAYASTG